MEILFKLAFMFARLCAFAFGGGYVMIPIMLKEVEANGWATAANLTNIVAIAGMSPGSVAVNAAMGLGYKVAGFPGAAAAFIGIALPNIIIVVLVAKLFFKVYDHPKVTAAFYGLRPVVTGIIIYAAVSFALKNSIAMVETSKIIENGIYIKMFGHNLLEVKSALITIISLILLIKTKIHPVLIIIASAIVGIIIF